MLYTKRLKIYPASPEALTAFIKSQTDPMLKTAYGEMLSGAMLHPDSPEWYTAWFVELSDGTHMGELCFMGLSPEGVTEIGYGICESFRGKGYAEDAVSAAAEWALCQPCVTRIEAEAE